MARCFRAFNWVSFARAWRTNFALCAKVLGELSVSDFSSSSRISRWEGGRGVGAAAGALRV